MSNHRKLIIIGSGPAGFTAAIYASRANLEPLLIEGEPVGPGDQPGGQLMNTTEIENYPGVIGLQGPELMAKMREQASTFGAEIITRRATKVDFSRRPFKVWVGDDEYTADAVIASTGAKPLMLGLEAEWNLMGRGVSACATCDGFFFRGKDIAVVGGGDTAMEEALFLTNFAATVTVIHRRDQLRASKVMQDRAKANPKIKFLWNTQVVGLDGEAKLTGLQLEDTVTGAHSTREIDGLFIAIGHQPNSELFQGQLDLRPDGYVVTTGVATSVPGVYAAGDLQDSRYRQAITSAGTGCMAALEAQRFIEENEHHVPTQAGIHTPEPPLVHEPANSAAG
jgi:thioredoxin reductase (NADPH)